MDTFDTYLSLILYFSFNKQTEDDHFKNLLIWSKSIMAFEYQINVIGVQDCQLEAVWPVKSRQMSIKVAQKWFH